MQFYAKWGQCPFPLAAMPLYYFSLQDPKTKPFWCLQNFKHTYF